eukprot:1630709-Pyramimonas_sp.AAC.1
MSKKRNTRSSRPSYANGLYRSLRNGNYRFPSPSSFSIVLLRSKVNNWRIHFLDQSTNAHHFVSPYHLH